MIPSRPRFRARRVTVSVLLGLGLVATLDACEPRGVRVSARAPASPRLVVVLPVELEHPHEPFDRWLATREVIRAVVGERRFGVLAPEEVSLLPEKYELARLHEETSLLVDAEREGYRPEEMVVLRATARRSSEDTERLVVGLAPKGSDTPDGRVLGRIRTVRAFAHVRVEIWHPATHVRLVHAERSFEEDLLAERRPGEPTQLSAAIADLVRGSLGPLARWLPSRRRAPVLPFGGAENPYALGALARAPAETLGAVPVDPGEALAAEARALERLREIDLRFQPADATALSARPTGLLLLGDAVPLLAGDYVTGVAGASGVFGLATLWRRWYGLKSGEELVLTVERAKESLDVRFAKP